MRFLIIILSLTLFACGGNDEVTTELINITPSADNNRSSDDLPIMEWQVDSINFKQIIEGDKYTATYKFRNVGDAPLVISKVETSCGCTAVKNWSQDPYQKGDFGEITVEFDSNRRPGPVNKTITVMANTFPSPNELKLCGYVIGPEKQ